VSDSAEDIPEGVPSPRRRLRLVVREALMRYAGFDPLIPLRILRNAPRFAREVRAYRETGDGGGFPLEMRSLDPIMNDYEDSAGTASGHYFHQDLWAARKVYGARPEHHVDIGSRIDGFVAHLLTFMSVTVVDVRPLTSEIEGLTFLQGDATELAAIPSDSVESLSSLHAVEHFGLGRYGDPVDATAHLRAMRAFARVLRPGGRLLFSTPIGRQRLEFNAQRIFAPQTVIGAFATLRLESFSAVDDSGAFHRDAEPEAFARARFACGMFEFVK
jgi:SAM-dependent methyltransferase